jgi:uncharacterized membrane protein (UPF0127 family)
VSIVRARALNGIGAVAVAAVLLACAPSSDSADSTPPAAPSSRPAVPAAPQLPQAMLADGGSLDLELALTQEEIAQGLMFRPSLPENRGMLFLFPVERVPSFWMKNTLIPLDLLFLAGDGTIVEIVERAQPCAAEPCPQYIPGRAVWAVLEVNAGFTERHGLAVGDRFEFERVPGYPK